MSIKSYLSKYLIPFHSFILTERIFNSFSQNMMYTWFSISIYWSIIKYPSFIIFSIFNSLFMGWQNPIRPDSAGQPRMRSCYLSLSYSAAPEFAVCRLFRAGSRRRILPTCKVTKKYE